MSPGNSREGEENLGETEATSSYSFGENWRELMNLNQSTQDDENGTSNRVRIDSTSMETDVESNATESGSSKIPRYTTQEKGKAPLNFDLNVPLEVHRTKEDILDTFMNFIYKCRADAAAGLDRNLSIFSKKEEENGRSNIVTIDLDSDVDCDEIESSSSKRPRYTTEEKGKHTFNFVLNGEEIVDTRVSRENQEELKVVVPPNNKQFIMSGIRWRRRMEKERYQTAKSEAEKFAYFNIDDAKASKNENDQLPYVEEESDSEDKPFDKAIKMIKKRNYQKPNGKRNSSLPPDIKWTPKKSEDSKRVVPSLMDLTFNTLVNNYEGIQSLEHVPDELRHKFSKTICARRNLDAHVFELLTRDSPTEIRVNDCSRLTEEDIIRFFGDTDQKNLMVLQLDLAGRSISDIVLHESLGPSSCKLPALVTLSLRGAYRLTGEGITEIYAFSTQIQSINLSECSLLTSPDVRILAHLFTPTLRELYLDDCENIHAMHMLPALKKLKSLEVLSVAGILTVCDGFVVALVRECGVRLKELVFAKCVDLTDESIKFVGEYCPNLRAIDLSHITNLTDSAIESLANGCLSMQGLRLNNNKFSDQAVAAFLEVAGSSLRDLSLNRVSKVGSNTALSLAKCSRKLFTLDLSWCRKVTDEELGMIVDNCSSLRLLKLFGCTQITNVFVNGHSNLKVHIVGLKLTPILEHLDLLEDPEPAIRYQA